MKWTPLCNGHYFEVPMVSAIERFHCIFNAWMIYIFHFAFKTGSSTFSVFINGFMYGGKLRLVMTLEKKLFKTSATIWSSLQFFLLLFFHLFLLKWFYLFLQFYRKKVV